MTWLRRYLRAYLTDRKTQNRHFMVALGLIALMALAYVGFSLGTPHAIRICREPVTHKADALDSEYYFELRGLESAAANMRQGAVWSAVRFWRYPIVFENEMSSSTDRRGWFHIWPVPDNGIQICPEGTQDMGLIVIEH